MRKDVSGRQRSKFKKSEKMMRKDFHEVIGQSSKNQKNDEKILSDGGEVQNKKIRKNDEKRRFRRSKVKVQKIRFLLNALENEENKGNNAMF